MVDYSPVDARPVKRFFVEMLTRDISLEEAILDLLDNCVDGILRSSHQTKDIKSPYMGYSAKITVNKNTFQIEDNCGGIPWSEHDRAFRMGSPRIVKEDSDNEVLSVGTYGIGMKRAIFKMGTQALIWTQNRDNNYEVNISPDWINSEVDWNLTVKEGSEGMSNDGTIIIVENLYPEISEHFSAEVFEKNLLEKIEQHYAVIIEKGFTVTVNNKTAKHKPIVFRYNAEKIFDGKDIKPFMYKSNDNGVEVFLAVGLHNPIPSPEALLAEQETPRFSSENAGWTVICNDRVVLFCNRDELTGWGTAGVPKYHTQFIAISGIVEFRGDPTKLPTTTTKRGLDVSSALYQRTLDKMREGTLIFTNFTNKWKTREEEVKDIVMAVSSVNFTELKKQAAALEFHKVRTDITGEQFKPELPTPPEESNLARISYWREKIDIQKLADQLIDDITGKNEKDIRREVGEASFDYAFRNLINKELQS